MEAPIWFRWLGVAGIELRANDEVLAIDPFFTRPPVWRVRFGRVPPNRQLVAEKIRRCDYILVTHAHWDHVMDVPDVACNTGATVLGSPNTCRLLAACGVPEEQIREIKGGDQIRLGDFKVEILPTGHMTTPGFSPGPLGPDLQPPLRLRDYRMDSCFSFLVEVGGLRALDCSSLRPGPAPPADVLFLGLGGTRSHYQWLLRAARPRLVIPVHWDDLFRPLSKPVRPYFKPPSWGEWPPIQRMDPTRFKHMSQEMAPDVRVLVPEMFRVCDIRRSMRR
jgi:L-ascorbate metabolism protein UlaG (beta-lactamase superfamily)